ncbi:MAG: exodeoxyribonuclease VII large subunit [Verrucomicrobiota bacterium]
MPLKSQWDFGELFPPQAVRRVWTVAELTGSIRRVLEKEFGMVWVTGEITNLRAQSSGHFYFTIKDAAAQLACVLFRNEARGINRDWLQDGAKVILHGELTVYEARGQYQLRVLQLEPQGLGALQAAFERLKQKLQAEGLFDSAHKRPLPRYPLCLGIVTSPTGAALRDVMHVIQRRQPGLRLILATCRVQGQGAAEEIACAIRLLNEWNDRMPEPAPPEHEPLLQGLTRPQPVRPRIDLILVTRGGGSLEDLWAFNEELVARAIYESRLPVVSAVGHEIDFTIADFVADLRAATPSAAAELITEGVFSNSEFVQGAAMHLRELLRDRLALERERLSQCVRRADRAHPRKRLQEQTQWIDDLQLRLTRCAQQGWRKAEVALQHTGQRLLRLKPSQILMRRKETLDRAQQALGNLLRLHLRDRTERLAHAGNRLRLLSPAHVLERGYSITFDAATGKIVKQARETQPGQKLRTKLHLGELESTINQVHLPPAESA